MKLNLSLGHLLSKLKTINLIVPFILKQHQQREQIKTKWEQHNLIKNFLEKLSQFAVQSSYGSKESQSRRQQPSE